MENVILHYSIGLNKNRGGGLTKYSDDLMDYQSKNNTVILLYPGEKKLFNKQVKIKKERNYKKIKVFSIVNPLSLPMLFGLKDEEYLTKKTDINLWINFLKSLHVNIIHIHSLMGLYEEFIDAANSLNIKIIYTTHDYFGLCPKQTLFFNNNICECYETCENCAKCNENAFSKNKSILIHSKLFYIIRKFNIVKIIKGKLKANLDVYNNKENDIDDDNITKNSITYYIQLKEKYQSIFSKINYFHYNSSVSQKVFNRYLNNIKGEVINISHSGIIDNRRIKNFSNDKLSITYLGPATAMKGFDIIISSLDNIYLNNNNFVLNIYTNTNIEREYLIKNSVGYKYSELDDIFNKTDLIIVASNWYETFGFNIPEALSYGVPIIVTENVGAKDLLVNNKTGFIVNKNNLIEKIQYLIDNREELKIVNQNICNMNFENFETHCNKIMKLYEKFI